jgi:uncharacterized membrane protein YdjX (TVP38/TMEM64 family)
VSTSTPPPGRRSGWWIIAGLIVALVIVPFLLFADQVTAFSDRTLAAADSPLARASIVVALLASDVLLPIPSSIVGTAAGALLGFQLGTAAAALGMTLGCMVGYGLGRRFGRAGASRLVGPQELERAAARAVRFGEVAVLACRPVPVLAEASVVAAGVIRAPFARFLFVVAGANLAISAWYAAVGATAATQWEFVLASLIAFLLPAAGVFGHRAWRRRRATDSPKSSTIVP